MNKQVLHQYVVTFIVTTDQKVYIPCCVGDGKPGQELVSWPYAYTAEDAITQVRVRYDGMFGQGSTRIIDVR